MHNTTVGQLMINRVLPEDLRDNERVLSKKGIKALLQEVAEKHPEKYRRIAKDLSDIGRDAAFTSGGYSFGLGDMRQSLAARKMRLELGKDLRTLYADNKLSDDQREQKIIELVGARQQRLVDDVFEESKTEQNPLAKQAISGSRGNKFNLNSLRGADLLYTDHRGRVLPIPVMRSYAMGLKPHEYFAGAFGARKGILDLQAATRDAGFFSKQLGQAAHRLLVSKMDADEPYDEMQPRGLPVDTDDIDNDGALLAQPVGGYARNMVLSPKILRELKSDGVDKILVRSPLVGGPKDGGVFARDVGNRERGGLAPLGDYVGIAAAQALAEPITQAQICLASDTLVRMADWSVKSIEEIEPGDSVRGADKAGQTFPVRVLQRYDNGVRDCVETFFRDPCDQQRSGVSLISTVEHKVLMWRKATDSPQAQANNSPQALPVGTSPGCYLTALVSEQTNICPVLVRESPRPVGRRSTCDLEVDHPEHLFVLANGLIVSNSSKHTGGIAGAAGAGAISGFKYINALVQVPKVFPDGASHARIDGRVTDIREAAQGGYYVDVGGEEHYVANGYPLKVKKGDEVEAGDVLSQGTPNPAEIVKHKGIGEGRRYLTQAFRQALADSGTYGNRRNIELLSRGLINHVRLTEEVGDWVQDDVVPYQMVESNWRPRQGHQIMATKQAVGKYLERPILHYSVGTKVRPSMLENMDRYGVKNLTVHPDPPPFQPEMIRGMANVAHDPDWLTRQLGSYQKNSLLEGARRGAVSDEAGSSYVPALVRGEDFGRAGITKGYELNETSTITQ